MNISVVVRPLQEQILFGRVFRAVPGAVAESGEKIEIEDAFEALCAKTAAMPPQQLFFSSEGRDTLLLLEAVSESYPHFFRSNLVTARVRSILTRLSNCPPAPEPPAADDSGGEQEHQEEDPVDIAARVVTNISGEIARNRGPQLFQFSSSAPIIFEFVIDHSKSAVHYVEVQTAGLLWPGATAFSALVSAAAAAAAADRSIPTSPAGLENLSASLRRADVILEVGCGLGMLSCAVASFFAITSQESKRTMILSDLHFSAAELAKSNAERAAGAADASHFLDIHAQALDWKDRSAIGRVKEAAMALSTTGEAVLVASEVIYDEEMGRDVARLLSLLLLGEGSFAAAFIVVMDYRVGISEFVSTCTDSGLVVERTSCSNDFHVTVSDSVEKNITLLRWSLFAVTRK